MKSRSLTFCLAIVLCSFPLLAVNGHDHHLMPGEKLGSVSFPVSCAVEVQRPFERGVALLHSFEYESADHQFQEVAEHDPQCAMAYWGRAMSLYHELWNRTSKEDLKRGHEWLEKARQLKTKTPREREYIDALAVYFQDSDKLEYRQRTSAYATAMEGVYQHNPNDREAAVFYALSLLASDHGDDPTLANDRKAVAILNKIFDRQPDHPGVAHYIIHSCDNPQMASLGLVAARKYAAIAPSSPHAVHMPSHIFARLGLWQEDIASNSAALRAADKMAAMRLHVMHHRMHSMDFMHYAYLQIGDDANAQRLYDELKKYNRADIEKDYQDYYDEMVTSFAARYAVERKQWKVALALPPLAGAQPNIQLGTYWAHAVAAGRMHDSRAAENALKTYESLLDEIKKGPKAYIADNVSSEHEEVQAWAAYAQGKTDEATRILRAIADRQDKVGKFEVEIPAREMLADMLLEMKRPQDALTEYERSLKTDPNRFNGLYGAAEAAEALNKKDEAAGYYAQLLKNCEGVNSDRPELVKARMLLAKK
ncbi:MAG TPA: tetratricopeptide repeat protein [Candidatus Limnocylindrales bacterium]|nr:tetratricopeptide repeat protein [Candidatus Limnocylindrales bacterium]